MAVDASKWRYISELDGLRGIAILMVIAIHAHLPFAGGGFLGVDLFFVLSGYLITTLLLKEQQATGDINFKSFYWRRCIRLFPVLFAFLVLYLALGLIFASNKFNILRNWLIVFFYGTSWTRALFGGPSSWVGHTWSLSIEEQFYLLWPVILYKARRVNPKKMIAALVATCIIVVFYRYSLLVYGVKTDRIFFGFDTRMDALIIGCTMAYLLNRRFAFMDSAPWNIVLKACALSGVVFMAYEFAFPSDKSNWFWSYGLSLVTISSAFIILFILSNPDSIFTRLLRNKGVVYTGKISYGLYLWHYPIFSFLQEYTRLTLTAQVIIGVTLSYAVSSLSFYLLERPLLKYKDLLGRKVASAPPAPSGEIAEYT